MPERDLAEMLDEIERLAALVFGRVVVLIEADLLGIDALGAAGEARCPIEQVRALGLGQIAGPNDVDQCQRSVMLAVELAARAQIFPAHGVVEIVQDAVLDVGDAGVADAHLHVGVCTGPAPLRPERQQQVAGLEQPALAQTLSEPGALRHHQAQPDVALLPVTLGVLEIDQAIGRIDALGQRRAGAGRHGKVDGDLQFARHFLVHLLVEGEVFRARRCGTQPCIGRRQEQEKPCQPYGLRHYEHSRRGSPTSRTRCRLAQVSLQIPFTRLPTISTM